MLRLWSCDGIGHVRVSVVRAKEVGRLVPPQGAANEADDVWHYEERDEDEIVVIAKSPIILETLKYWDCSDCDHRIVVSIPVEAPTFQKVNEVLEAEYRSEYNIPPEVSVCDYFREDLELDKGLLASAEVSEDIRRCVMRTLRQLGEMPGYVRRLPQGGLLTEDFLLLVEDDEECLRAAVQFLIDCNVDEKIVPNWRQLADRRSPLFFVL